MTCLRDRSFTAMGTSCRFAATVPDDPRVASRVFDAARAEVARCERVLTRFDASSDLSRANAAAGSWVEVDEILIDALERALQARAATDGLFDPTVLPALIGAGYDRSFELLAGAPRDARPPDGYRPGARVDLDRARRRVRIERDSAIDLGGIGKGFAAVRAVRSMQIEFPGLDGCLADLGGDISVAGEPPEGGHWHVSIVDPRAAGVTLGVLVLAGAGTAGVATSGRDRRRFGAVRERHHLIDPSTGMPAVPGPLTVTVAAPNAIAAETNATALAILPVEQAAGYIAARPGISAVLVPKEGLVACLGEPPLLRQRTLRLQAVA
jgi:thiamine biosynthesis lipoprotein